MKLLDISFRRPARGFIAIGNIAVGFVAIGVVSVGAIAVGMCSFGIVALVVGMAMALGTSGVGAFVSLVSAYAVGFSISVLPAVSFVGSGPLELSLPAGALSTGIFALACILAVRRRVRLAVASARALAAADDVEALLADEHAPHHDALAVAGTAVVEYDGAAAAAIDNHHALGVEAEHDASLPGVAWLEAGQQTTDVAYLLRNPGLEGLIAVQLVELLNHSAIVDVWEFEEWWQYTVRVDDSVPPEQMQQLLALSNSKNAAAAARGGRSRSCNVLQCIATKSCSCMPAPPRPTVYLRVKAIDRPPSRPSTPVQHDDTTTTPGAPIETPGAPGSQQDGDDDELTAAAAFSTTLRCVAAYAIRAAKTRAEPGARTAAAQAALVATRHAALTWPVPRCLYPFAFPFIFWYSDEATTTWVALVCLGGLIASSILLGLQLGGIRIL